MSRRRRALTGGALVLLALPLLATPAWPQDSPPEPEHRWHTPRRGARQVPRHVVEAHPDDWNPLARPVAQGKARLKELGITSDTWLMFFHQAASRDGDEPNHYGTFAWRSIGDLELFTGSPVGAGYLEWNFNGTSGMSYDEGKESLSENAGIAQIANTNVFPDGAALDELFWKQVWPEERFVVLFGRVDHSYHFDVNRIANDSYTKLLSFSLVNNLSIPWPLYGGLGAVVQWKVNEHVTLRVGGGDSAADEPWAFWETVDDKAWYQLAELDLRGELPWLGKGQLRITPWHNHIDGRDGWGFGVNLDQELGLPWLVLFFRYGLGSADVTPFDRHVSGGLAVERPFRREHDLFAVGVAWSSPSGPGTREETLLEIQYRLGLTASLQLSPTFQWVFNPADNPRANLVFVPGVRLTLAF